MLAGTLNFIANFAALLLAISLFIAPFLAVFIYRQRRQIADSRPHFNYLMERFFISPESNALVAVWAAAEAIAWFVIPEFLLFLMIFMKIERKLDLVKYDLLGTIAGTLIALIWQLPQKALVHLPFIRLRMITQVNEWFQLHGVWGLANQPFSGVPYKVFVHQAVNYRFFIPLFLVVAIIARMVRYFVIYEATKAIYPLLHKFVRRHYAILYVVAIAVFTGLLVHVVNIYK